MKRLALWRIGAMFFALLLVVVLLVALLSGDRHY